MHFSPANLDTFRCSSTHRNVCSDNNFKNLLNNIKLECYETTQFHNSLRVIDTTRNFHYFVKYGELMSHLSDLQVMAGLLACMMHDVAHPGVNNNFLIGIKHQKALRYNDISVLENHHCAIAFKLLLDPKNDIFELLSEAQYWNVRQIITKMILSTDITNHFILISKYNFLNFIILLFFNFRHFQGKNVDQEVPRGHR